jgi:hypothetical protein
LDLKNTAKTRYTFKKERDRARDGEREQNGTYYTAVLETVHTHILD